MLNDFAFLIPYRGDGGFRDRILEWILKRYDVLFPGVPVYVADSNPDVKFNRSEARNNAFKQSKEKYIAFCDADTFWSKNLLLEALNVLPETNWLIPYKKYLITQPVNTNRILASDYGIDFIESDYSYDIVVENHTADVLMPPISGIQLFESEKFYLTGGFDERYDGWGYEDNALVHTANLKLGLYSRIEGSICHIWHPINEDGFINSVHVEKNRIHYRNYINNFDQMHENFLGD
jgi:predicted glycosyltransferase involved in capsule biosynthesis